MGIAQPTSLQSCSFADALGYRALACCKSVITFVVRHEFSTTSGSQRWERQRHDLCLQLLQTCLIGLVCSPEGMAVSVVVVSLVGVEGPRFSGC